MDIRLLKLTYFHMQTNTIDIYFPSQISINVKYTQKRYILKLKPSNTAAISICIMEIYPIWLKEEIVSMDIQLDLGCSQNIQFTATYIILPKTTLYYKVWLLISTHWIEFENACYII